MTSLTSHATQVETQHGSCLTPTSLGFSPSVVHVKSFDTWGSQLFFCGLSIGLRVPRVVPGSSQIGVEYVLDFTVRGASQTDLGLTQTYKSRYPTSVIAAHTQWLPSLSWSLSGRLSPSTVPLSVVGPYRRLKKDYIFTTARKAQSVYAPIVRVPLSVISIL